MTGQRRTATGDGGAARNGDARPEDGYAPRVLGAAVDAAEAFLADAATCPVRPDADRPALEAALGGHLPARPTDPVAVLRDMVAGIGPGLLVTQSPRFFGFVIGGSQPVALAADWLTSAWDQNAGLYSASPAAAVAERAAGGWVVDLLGLPGESSVGFVTGGQMATWTCLAAARHHVLSEVGWDVERQGLFAAPPVNVVVGEQRHGTVDRALRFLGLGSDRIATVDADPQGRMRADHLASVLAGTDGPTIVVAEAGNVNTGAFDPLGDIVALAHAHRAWVHVDGAFGLWTRASARRRHLAEGAEAADSWSVDAHKWLNVPFDSGLAITRHPEAHQAALGHAADYLVVDTDSRYDQLNWNPEHSRRARGLTVWATLRCLGRDGVEDLVDRLCDRTLQFAEALGAAEGVEVVNEVVANQLLVRFTDANDADAHTRAVVARVQAEGTCWMSATTWQGRAAMRISVSNWATSPDDVDRAVEAILTCRAADARERRVAPVQ